MNKIQRVSHFFRIIFQIAFIVVIISFIAAWLFGPAGFNINEKHIKISMGLLFTKNFALIHSLPLGTKLLAFLLDLIPTAINLFMLYLLIELFKAYEKAQIFTLRNVIYVRNIGYALFFKQIISPIHQFLLSYLLSHNHTVEISLSGIDFGIIFLALLIILVSWIMGEGYKLLEEQQLTI